jgi:hypothetical protein
MPLSQSRKKRNPVELWMLIKLHGGIGILSWKKGKNRIFGICRPGSKVLESASWISDCV